MLSPADKDYWLILVSGLSAASMVTGLAFVLGKLSTTPVPSNADEAENWYQHWMTWAKVYGIGGLAFGYMLYVFTKANGMSAFLTLGPCLNVIISLYFLWRNRQAQREMPDRLSLRIWCGVFVVAILVQSINLHYSLIQEQP